MDSQQTRIKYAWGEGEEHTWLVPQTLLLQRTVPALGTCCMPKLKHVAFVTAAQVGAVVQHCNALYLLFKYPSRATNQVHPNNDGAMEHKHPLYSTWLTEHVLELQRMLPGFG
jgi:hypothetical protein